MYSFLFFLFLFHSLVFFLGIKKKQNFIYKFSILFLLLLHSHILFLLYFSDFLPLKIILGLFFFCFISYLSFFLPSTEKGIGKRIQIMMGGRFLLLVGTAALLLQIPISIFSFFYYERLGLSASIFLTDIIFSYFFLFCFLLNGAFRLLFTSKRLRIIKRLLFLWILFIPFLNLVIILYCCYVVKQEYEHECFKTEIQLERTSSFVCKTKYPLLMLHGIGFQDYKYLNYWGRIPKRLIQNGSTIFYGHQQAWGTIETNAEEIRKNLLKILKETKCNKVNIIAHSKGGLDARYLISTLQMGEYVASLTTISTPHQGSALLEVLDKLPDSTYRKITSIINKYFLKIGDTMPDSYCASKQLLPSYLEKFNQENPDSPLVYYQSYASAMRSASSDSLLSIPYLLMRWLSGDNDGLVTVESSQWGHFKGVMISEKQRGISHGDVIDLKREDIPGFDITEKYVEIVSELKNMGF